MMINMINKNYVVFKKALSTNKIKSRRKRIHRILGGVKSTKDF